MDAGSPTVFERHARRRVGAEILALALLAALSVPMGVFAGKGGGTSTTPWIALASVDGATARSTMEPRLGGAVRFATGYATNTKNPWVSVTCWQYGVVVWAQGGIPSTDFYLGGASSDWQRNGGAATCRAELGDLYWRGGQQYYTYLAHTSFDAAG